MQNSNEIQFKKMTESPVKSLILSLAVPTIITMMITSIYNSADTYFVSKLGTSASGAVGIVFSLMAIIQACGFTLGMGSGSMISRLLGRQEEERANVAASSAFFAAILIGLVLLAVGTAFKDEVMRLLGASDTILPYARSYVSYILFAAPVMMCVFVMNNILRSEGLAKFAMIGVATGGVLNILLDPIFIFVFRLGISGAAIATALSQCVSFVILLTCFLKGKSTTTISIKKISLRFSTYLEIIQTGLPSFCRQGLASAATILLNLNAAVYGDAAVAAMSIVTKAFMLIFSAILGFGQGYQPVVGYNYGANRIKRVREAFLFNLGAGFVIMTSFAVLGFIFAPQVMTFFIKDDPEVIKIGAFAFRAQCVVMPLLPLNVTCNMTYQSIGRSWTAAFLSILRQGVFFIPFILILPRIWGLAGVEFTQAASDLCSCIVSVFFAVRFLRGLKTQSIII